MPPDLRNLVYAFDRSFEMAIAALAAPLVGLLAEHVFGFSVRGMRIRVRVVFPTAGIAQCSSTEYETRGSSFAGTVRSTTSDDVLCGTWAGTVPS